MIENIYSGKYHDMHAQDAEKAHEEFRALVKEGIFDKDTNYCPWCTGPATKLRDGLPDPPKGKVKPMKIDLGDKYCEICGSNEHYGSWHAMRTPVIYKKQGDKRVIIKFGNEPPEEHQ